MRALSLPLLLSGLLAVSGPAFAYDYTVFQSPTGNIVCGMFDDGPDSGVRCDMYSMTVQSITTPPPDCEFDWGSSFWIGAAASRGGLACVSDPVAVPPIPTLGYGRSMTFGGVTCTSEKTGMTCKNSRGHGFSISKAKQRVF